MLLGIPQRLWNAYFLLNLSSMSISCTITESALLHIYDQWHH